MKLISRHWVQEFNAKGIWENTPCTKNDVTGKIIPNHMIERVNVSH